MQTNNIILSVLIVIVLVLAGRAGMAFPSPTVVIGTAARSH